VKGLLAGALIALTLVSASAASAQRPPVCAADLRGKCLVRPHILGTGAHTYVRGIRWRIWNHSTALGYGTLVEAGGYTYSGFKKPAKVRLTLPAECNGRLWFWRTSVNFGRKYGQRYLHNDNLTPCY